MSNFVPNLYILNAAWRLLVWGNVDPVNEQMIVVPSDRDTACRFTKHIDDLVPGNIKSFDSCGRLPRAPKCFGILAHTILFKRYDEVGVVCSSGPGANGHVSLQSDTALSSSVEALGLIRDDVA